jgi:ABC-type antimicrobial peptide transport system permease subunit
MSTSLLHVLALLIAPALSWNLSYFTPLHAPLVQVAVWRNRAFICVPRYDTETVRATLLEATWPETINSTRQETQQVQAEFPSPKKVLNQQNIKEYYISVLSVLFIKIRNMLSL